jgi:hypothetical protein
LLDDAYPAQRENGAIVDLVTGSGPGLPQRTRRGSQGTGADLRSPHFRSGQANRFAHHKLLPVRLASQSRSCSAQALLPFRQGVESSILSALNLGEVLPVADCSQVQIGVVYPQNELRGDP